MNRPVGFNAAPRLRRGLFLLCTGALLFSVAAMRARGGAKSEPSGAAVRGPQDPAAAPATPQR